MRFFMNPSGFMTTGINLHSGIKFALGLYFCCRGFPPAMPRQQKLITSQTRWCIPTTAILMQ